MRPDRKLMQTYVFCDEKAFFVSTCDRQSSAETDYPIYYAETLVWELDPATNKRGEIVHQGSCAEGSITTHQQIASQLFESGTVPE